MPSAGSWGQSYLKGANFLVGYKKLVGEEEEVEN